MIHPQFTVTIHHKDKDGKTKAYYRENPDGSIVQLEEEHGDNS